jgi:DnaJ family protein C protein 3
MLRRASASLELKNYYEVVADSGRVLKLEAGSIVALEIRGNAYFKLGEHEMAVNHYREALKFDPEHRGCKDGHKLVKKLTKKIKKAEEASAKGKDAEAVKLWYEAIDIAPNHNVFAAPALIKISKSYIKLKKFVEAIREVEKAIALHEGPFIEGHIALSEAQIAGEKYDEGVNTLRKARDMLSAGQHEENPPDIKTLNDKLQKAEIALKQSKSKNYYKILEIQRNADKKEIKSAYKAMARVWHPDKNMDNEEEAASKFQLIAEAYEVLSDDELRVRYDRGEDVMDKNNGGGGGGGGQHFQHNFHQNFHGFGRR